VTDDDNGAVDVAPNDSFPAFDAASAGAAVTCLAVLIAVAMHRSLPIANADSLLYGLMSTEQLTVFYWGQDRLANVVPALAWPVQDLRWNYLLQTALLASSFFALIGVFTWFHVARSACQRSWGLVVASSTLTGAIAICLLTRTGAYSFVLEQQYALSTLLYVVGIAGLSARGGVARVAGAGAILVATMIIPTTVLLAPIALVVGDGTQLVRRLAWTGALSACALAVTNIAARTMSGGFPASDTYTNFSIARLRVGAETAANSIVDSTNRWFVCVVALAVVSVLVVRWRTFDTELHRTYVVAPLIALGWLLLFATNRWVEINLFLYRYFFPVYAAGLLAVAGAVAEVVAWCARLAPLKRRLPGVASALLASVVAVTAVVASAALAGSVDLPVLERGADLAQVADDHDADLIVGDYWQVWPAMFAARAEGNDGIVAVTFRAAALRDEIREVGRAMPAVTALCVDVDEVECVAELRAASGGDWQIVTVRSRTPLVVDVALSR
jgi:hypothetical protein